MNKGEAYLDSWEQQMGHISYRSYIKNNFPDSTNFIPDQNFASMLNKHGLVQIDNKVYVVRQNYVVTLPIGNEYILSALANYSDSTIDKTLASAINAAGGIVSVVYNEVETVSNEIGTRTGVHPPLPSDPTVKSGVLFLRKSSVQNTWNAGDEYHSHKLVGEVWNCNYLIYSSFGLRTKHETKKYSFSNWRTTNYDYLEFYGSFRWKKNVDHFITTTVIPITTGSGTGNYDRTIEHMESTPGYYFQVLESSTHHALCRQNFCIDGDHVANTY